MARNGSGTYSLPTGNPVVTGTVISSTVQNNTMSDVATALTNSIAKNGETTVTGNLPMGGFKLTGLTTGSASTDSATLGQVQSGAVNYVGTVGGTADVITLTPSPAITSYSAGQKFRFIASGANTTNVTVNVSAVGAKAITKSGTTALVAGDIPSGALVTINYDGTEFQLVSVGDAQYMHLAGTETVTGIKTFSGQTTNSGVVAFTGGGLGPQAKQNHSITASVAANALTCALKGKDGNDPSATNPVTISLRSTTLTSGLYNIRQITAASSVVAPQGATLGFTASQTAKVHFYECDDGSTRALGICGINPVNDDTILISTTTIGTGSDSAGTIYTTAGLTNAAVSYLGYITIQTGATPGDWSNSPTIIFSGLTNAIRDGVNIQTFTATGANTWTKPIGYSTTAQVRVQVWGAGGSGGRLGSNGANGGGGGSYIELWKQLSELGSTETATVGAGGAGKSSNGNGNNGGSSSFGSYATAYGGAGGSTTANAGGGAGGGWFATPAAASLTNDLPFNEGIGVAGANGGIGRLIGGGGGSGNSAGTGFAGGASIYAGGGGGGEGTTGGAGGTSVYGGAGGAGGSGGASAGTAGTQPAGGGGATNNALTGAGGDGKIIITVIEGF